MGVAERFGDLLASERHMVEGAVDMAGYNGPATIVTIRGEIEVIVDLWTESGSDGRLIWGGHVDRDRRGELGRAMYEMSPYGLVIRLPDGRRERSQLSRGRKEIDARLDLHGMTQTRAHRALSGFLQRAHSDGLTFVLIITGKGKMGAESERGVLRRQVPQWLSLPEFRSLVVGFEEAHVGHGGEGALYVRIRRSRI